MRKTRPTHVLEIGESFGNDRIDDLLDQPFFRSDWEFIARYIESGYDIGPKLRKFLVAVLREQEKRPPWREKR
jgi:hypothetical protein